MFPGKRGCSPARSRASLACLASFDSPLTISMRVRRLTPADAEAFQSLRLLALQEAPSAFGSSYEEESAFPRSTIEGRLAEKPDRGPFGAFESGELVGLVALGRESMRKLSHKALIWGLYVAPKARSRGVGRALLREALSLARSVSGVRQVNLSVNAANLDAIRLYESLGFRAFGQEPCALIANGEPHDELHMCLRFQDG